MDFDIVSFVWRACLGAKFRLSQPSVNSGEEVDVAVYFWGRKLVMISFSPLLAAVPNHKHKKKKEGDHLTLRSHSGVKDQARCHRTSMHLAGKGVGSIPKMHLLARVPVGERKDCFGTVHFTCLIFFLSKR